MIRSINTKMLLLVFGILVTTALALMLFTRRDLAKKFLEAEEHSVRNVIYLVKLNIENQYGSLLFHKLSTIEKRKAEMQKLLGVVVSNINRFQQQCEQGMLHGGGSQGFRFGLDHRSEMRR